MCKDVGKLMQHWLANIETQKLITALEAIVGIPAALIYTEKSNSNPVIRGTYLHPELIVHLAMWISPEYGIKVARITLNYHNKRVDAKLYEYKAIIGEKDDKIDQLIQKVDAQSKDLSESKHINKELIRKVDDQSKDLSESKQLILNQSKDLSESKHIILAQNAKIDQLLGYSQDCKERLIDIGNGVDLLQDRADELKDNIVNPVVDNGKQETFTLLYVAASGLYHVLLRQVDTRDKGIREYNRNKPVNTVQELLVLNTANKHHLYTTIKRHMGQYLEFKHNDFTVRKVNNIDKINQAALIDRIKQLHISKECGINNIKHGLGGLKDKSSV